MKYRRHRGICDPMTEEDYVSDEGQSVNRLLDHLDILYTERQQRQRIAECRAMLPNRLYKRVYDAVLKGWSFIKIAKVVKRTDRMVYNYFYDIIAIIESDTISNTPPLSPNKVEVRVIP